MVPLESEEEPDEFKEGHIDETLQPHSHIIWAHVEAAFAMPRFISVHWPVRCCWIVWSIPSSHPSANVTGRCRKGPHS